MDPLRFGSLYLEKWPDPYFWSNWLAPIAILIALCCGIYWVVRPQSPPISQTGVHPLLIEFISRAAHWPEPQRSAAKRILLDIQNGKMSPDIEQVANSLTSEQLKDFNETIKKIRTSKR